MSFGLCEYNQTIMRAALFLASAVLLYSVLLLLMVCYWLLAAITLTMAERSEGGRGSAAPPRCRRLMLLLLFSLRSVPVQQPAASSSDVLTCVDLSVYLMMERDPGCYKSLLHSRLGDTHMQSQATFLTLFLLFFVLSCCYLELFFPPCLQLYSFNAGNYL